MASVAVLKTNPATNMLAKIIASLHANSSAVFGRGRPLLAILSRADLLSTKYQGTPLANAAQMIKKNTSPIF